MGQDLPGVLSLLPEDMQPEFLHAQRPLSLEALSQRLRSQAPLLVSNDQATMSLAGAQEKMGLRLDATTGLLSESVGLSPTTHILKPDTRQVRYQPSAINEYVCMRLARALKLPVPDVWLLRVPEAAYVVQRYDRRNVDGKVVGTHQFDGCQLLGQGSGWKYQRQGGLVSIPKIVNALRALPVRGVDLLQVQRWVMFNYLIGNADAHAKNLSVLVDNTGYRIAPFYDLLCVKAYGDDSLALYIGDEETFSAVGAHSWEALCADCGFRLPETLMGLRKMARDLIPAWLKVMDQALAEPLVTPPERELLQRMTDVFSAHAANALSMTQGVA
jgi:serine/threonine-protein kinase HipA